MHSGWNGGPQYLGWLRATLTMKLPSQTKSCNYLSFLTFFTNFWDFHKSEDKLSDISGQFLFFELSVRTNVPFAFLSYYVNQQFLNCFKLSVRTNVLHPLNWTREAGVVLRWFEQEVIRKTKTEGYDGQNNTRLVSLNVIL